MEDKELQELEEFSLEDIIKEFGNQPVEEVDAGVAEESMFGMDFSEQPAEDKEEEPETMEEPVSELLEATIVLPEHAELANAAAEKMPEAEAAVTADTIRLDTSEILKGVVHDARHIEDEENAEEVLREDTVEELAEAQDTQPEEPADAEQEETEASQPVQETVPQRPITFPTRAESREMKRQLVIGPEKRYYELTEKGLGKLQIAMFFCLLVVVASAVSTVAYAQGMIPENRLRLMIFGQFLAVLVSALLGSFQLIQGVADLFKGRFTLNTLLVVTFGVCCADGVFCLMQERIPCCAAFSLEVYLSLWSAYNRRHADLGQMDVLRKASRLCGMHACPEGYEDKKVLQRIPGQVEHFMDNYGTVSDPEKRQDVYALVALVFSVAIGVFTGVMRDMYMGIQMTAVSLLAAVPATAFIATTRPFAILQRRLHRLGAVLCGWQGVKQLCGKVIFPLYNDDLFPLGTTRMNGVKFFGSRSTEQVVAYAAAVVLAEGGSLANLFQQVLDSRNGHYYDAENLRHYDNGGLGGIVMNEPVLVGPMSFLKEMGVEVPDGIQVSQAVCVAIDGELCGLFAISYEKTRSATAGLSTLSSYRKLNPTMVSGRFMMDESFVRGKFGIKSKRFLFPSEESRKQICAVQPDADAEAALLTTMTGLAPMAYCVTGARALRTACNLGVILHMIGGILGMGVVLALVIVDAWHLLTPANMFLYQLVWMIPGLLLTEWTRSV